jgi:hypothetical protein
MPQSIPAGLTSAHVLQALVELDAGVDHTFGQPTGYELHHEGKRYPPKAVVGLACRHLIGRVLLPEEFSGGEAPGQANFVLRKLGFTVVRKDGPEASQDSDSSRDWTEREVQLIVADYFAMLQAELQGFAYPMEEMARRARLDHELESVRIISSLMALLASTTMVATPANEWLLPPFHST